MILFICALLHVKCNDVQVNICKILIYFFIKMALDELLQYIGEEYGLSASSQWWYTLQSLLVKTVVAAEIAASKRYPKLE